MKHIVMILLSIILIDCRTKTSEPNSASHTNEQSLPHSVDSAIVTEQYVLRDTIFQRFHYSERGNCVGRYDTLASNGRFIVSVEGFAMNDSFGIKNSGQPYFDAVYYKISVQQFDKELFSFSLPNTYVRSLIEDDSQFNRLGSFRPEFLSYEPSRSCFVFTHTLYLPESDAPPLNWFFAVDTTGNIFLHNYGGKYNIYTTNKFILTPRALFNLNGETIFELHAKASFLNDSTIVAVSYNDVKDSNIVILSVAGDTLWYGHFNCTYYELYPELNVQRSGLTRAVGLYDMNSKNALIISDFYPIQKRLYNVDSLATNTAKVSAYDKMKFYDSDGHVFEILLDTLATPIGYKRSE